MSIQTELFKTEQQFVKLNIFSTNCCLKLLPLIVHFFLRSRLGICGFGDIEAFLLLKGMPLASKVDKAV